MERYLIKKGKTHNRFLHLEVEGHLLRRTEGKEGLQATRQTTHCGTHKKALKAVEEIVDEHLSKGYAIAERKVVTEPIVFDKAEWHYDGDFPGELSSYQGYIHTGLYIGWLLKKGFFDAAFNNDNQQGIEEFLARKITCVTFYKDYMDGVFSSDDLQDEAIEFTKYYFGLDFADSIYINDFIELFCSDLPTVYHVEDTWENFEQIQKVIDQQFAAWPRKQIGE